MVGKIGRIGIGLLQTSQMFMGPTTFMTYADLIVFLQSQAFLPNGYRHPPGTLVVFESVAGDPGGSSGKLDIVKEYKDVGKVHSMEKSGIRGKIWPAGSYDHCGSS
jgi:hypothetical protein